MQSIHVFQGSFSSKSTSFALYRHLRMQHLQNSFLLCKIKFRGYCSFLSFCRWLLMVLLIYAEILKSILFNASMHIPNGHAVSFYVCLGYLQITCSSLKKHPILVVTETCYVASATLAEPMSWQSLMKVMMPCIMWVFTSLLTGFFILMIIQESVFWNAQEIPNEIQRQIRQAMYGIDKSVSDMQTALGIKDKVAQHWIEQLLAKAKELKRAQPDQPLESVVEEL